METTSTFSAALQQAEPEYEVLNAGVVGYLSSQEAALVFSKLVDLEPTLIIAFNGWNDTYDHYWWSIYGDPDVPHPGTNANFTFLEDRLVKYERTQTQPGYALWSTAVSFFRSSTLSRLVGRGVSARPRTPDVGDDELDEIVADYVQESPSNMVKVRDLLQARGGDLLVAVQPELGQFLDASAVRELRDQGTPYLRGDQYWRFFPRPGSAPRDGSGR